MSQEPLTELERDVVHRLGLIWNDICAITGPGTSRAYDLGEAVVHIHALQHMIMAQAAGRAYPDQFRTLGDSLIVKRAPADPTRL